jgi:hypothetical protein
VTSDANIEAPEPYHFNTDFTGVYEFCLRNDESGMKRISFDMINQKPDHRVESLSMAESKSHASTEHLSGIEMSLSKMTDKIEECSKLQGFHRKREAALRSSTF